MSRFLAVSALLGLCTGLAYFLMADSSRPGAPAEIKVRPSHESMARKQKPVRNEPREVKLAEVQEGKKGAVDQNSLHRKSRQRGGLVSRSAVLSSGYNWTLLPKGAVLHVPDLYQQRVNNARNGKLIGWQDFYGKNRGWIKVVPVTLEQATGESPLSEEFLASVKSSGQVVIAACKGGPISVLTPKETPESEEEAAKLARETAEKKARDAKAQEDLKRRLLSGAAR